MNPEPGDIVTIEYRGTTRPYVVYRTSEDALADGQHYGGLWVPLEYFAFWDVREGVNWCRGTSGPVVEALKVAQALT